MFNPFKNKSTSSLTVIFILFISHSISYAQWWNPLEPKDSDECIIKNLKSGMSEETVRALQVSCWAKYPQKKDSGVVQSAAKELDARYKKCGLTDDVHKTRVIFSLGGSRGADKTVEIISRLNTFKYEGVFNTASFQNINSFGISGIMIGFTNEKQCPRKTEEYRFSTYCLSANTDDGVSASTYGSFKCGELPKEAKSMGFCPIGYSPIYTRYDDSILKFLEKNKYCN